MTAAGEAPALDPEDEARAAFYGLIARLFYAPPDPDVLAQIQNARAFSITVLAPWCSSIQQSTIEEHVFTQHEATRDGAQRLVQPLDTG